MRYSLFLLSFGLFLPVTSFACASCGCSLSTDWQDSAHSPFKFDLRYDYVDQNQLRSSTTKVSSTDASRMTNNGNPQEVEKYTVNKYLTADLDYTLDSTWRFSLQLPFILRDHSTLGTASDGTTSGAGGGQYTSSTSNLGDIKLISRYQGFSESHNFGVTLGLKLPTGSHTLTGTSTDATNPSSVMIDRGLQPGTGTTDILFGFFYSQALDKNWDYFAEAIYQTALNSSDGYKPGNSVNLNLGTRFMAYEFWIPEIQLNSRVVQHDQGENADTISTGGTLVYLSPGLSIQIRHDLEVYGFVQIPVYQYLEGVQLAPTATESIGFRYFF